MALITLVTAALALAATSAYAQSTLGSRAHAVAQAVPVRPPSGLELPREEQGTPFYEADYGYHKSQPTEESGAPVYKEKLPSDEDYWTILAQAQGNPSQDTDAIYADLPSLPAQDLTPPLSVLQWNPENDPTLYFQLPVELTKEAVPTNTHPKKYHKVLVEKNKPTNSRPKEEISLIPVSEDELINAEKQLHKTAYNQAKVEHQRKLQYEKQQEVKQQEDGKEKVNTNPQRTYSGKGIDKSKSRPKKYRAHYSEKLTTNEQEHAYPDKVKVTSTSANNIGRKVEDVEGSATGFLASASPHNSLGASHEGLGSHNGDRVDFQLRGHAGPNSYKFGFDTGKGKG